MLECRSKIAHEFFLSLLKCVVLGANNNEKPINLWLWQTYEHVPFLMFVVSENGNKNVSSLSPLKQEIRLSALRAKKSFSRVVKQITLNKKTFRKIRRCPKNIRNIPQKRKT